MRRGAVLGVASLVCLFAGKAAGQPIPPADAHCIREMSVGIAAFTRAALEEVLGARIETGARVEPSPETVAALRETLSDDCTAIPLFSMEGVCGDAGSLSDWIDCVVETQRAGVIALVDALLGGSGGLPNPTVTPSAAPGPSPTVTITPNPPTPRPTCAARLQSCLTRNCCGGLVCRYSGLSLNPLCLTDASPSGAFLDTEEARFF